MEKIQINITFRKELRLLLHPGRRELDTIDHTLNYHGSIKDVIESLRVPHTEVGRLTVNTEPVDFSHRVQNEDNIVVNPLKPPVNPCKPDFLRPEPLPEIRFMTDVNVAKLCSLLRMAGFDTTCLPGLSDRDIAETAAREKRILLSRDRGLMKRKIISHGHLIRAQLPEVQLKEVIHLYGLADSLHPFCRCMSCNGILAEIEKEAIIHRLEPLTRKYYNTFYHCPECDKIYWSGSHKTGMIKLLTRILEGC